MKSIIEGDSKERCFRCKKYRPTEEHHIFGGPNRKLSEKYGLKVHLCHFCHNEKPDGVHFNRENELELKRIGQREFEKAYPNIDFLQTFGRNYL